MDSEERVLCYGIVGVGMMGREHMLNLAALPGARVVAVADPYPPSQQAALDTAASLDRPGSSRLQVSALHALNSLSILLYLHAYLFEGDAVSLPLIVAC